MPESCRKKIRERIIQQYGVNLPLSSLPVPATTVVASTHTKGSPRDIPTIANCAELIGQTYTLEQLKQAARVYGLVIAGNKPVLTGRVLYYLRLSAYAVKIQKVFRSHLVREFIWVRGPARYKRDLCNNLTDFVTMEPVAEIPLIQFISYTDSEGMVYGFDITSLHQLFLKNPHDIHKNPYTRKKLPSRLFKTIRKLIRLGNLIGIKMNMSFEVEKVELSETERLERNVRKLFRTIDDVGGHYTSASWFLSLSRNRLISYNNQLHSIWQYRAELPRRVRLNICPPYGNPFSEDMYRDNVDTITTLDLQNRTLNVMHKLVNSGIDRESRILGIYYVLGALTLVSAPAAETMPWLYESFNQIV